MNPRPAHGRDASFSTNFSTPTAFGPASFQSSATLTGSSFHSSFTNSTPFGSLNFNLNSAISGSLNSALTFTRNLSLSETINGQTARFSTNGSVTLTAAQLAAALLARNIRRNEHAAIRQAQLNSMSAGYGSSAMASPYMSPGYSGGSYGGPGYGYGGMGYGGGARSAQGQPTAPGVRTEGYEENRAGQDQQSAANRLLAANGVTDSDGRLLWPVGLRSLPADRDGQLRDRVDALLTQAKEQATAGAVPANLRRDLVASVNALRKQLLRDKDERFSLTYQAYDDAEDYLARLDQAAQQLVKAGEARELRSGQSGKKSYPEQGGQSRPVR
jgi:hypothetical protein